MSKPVDKELMSRILFDKYGKIALLPKEAAEVLGVSEDALKKDRQEAIGIPFTRRNNKENGTPLYNITSIANLLIDNESKTV